MPTSACAWSVLAGPSKATIWGSGDGACQSFRDPSSSSRPSRTDPRGWWPCCGASQKPSVYFPHRAASRYPPSPAWSRSHIRQVPFATASISALGCSGALISRYSLVSIFHRASGCRIAKEARPGSVSLQISLLCRDRCRARLCLRSN